MSCFAIVPAKGRSVRLPNKNAKPLLGVPLIRRTVNALMASDCFDAVWVSTDDATIADLAHNAGAEVLHRPDELAQDRSTVNQVCLHWLSQLTSPPTSFCCCYPTAVFLTAQDFQQAQQQLTDQVDGVMGVSRYNYPPVQALVRNEQGQCQPLMPDYMHKQSQYYPDCVVSNGSQYWAWTDAYLTQQTFYLNRLAAFLTDERHILDINTIEDFNQAERRARRLGWSAG